MKILQSSLHSKDGLRLQLHAWEPDARPKGIVALLHGLGEHILRFALTAELLVKAGYGVMGFDLRGHGRSGGPRGHTPSYEMLLADVDTLLEWVKTRHSRIPVFLYGHSLGGALALVYALRRAPKIRGVIVTAPWLRTVVQVSPLKIALARLVDPILPTYTQHWPVEPANFSHNAAVGTAYEHDPLVHNLITTRMYRVSTEAGAWALEHAHEFPLPLLLMHGTKDRLTSWEASQEFARRLGKRCTWYLWDGWYHELHNEVEGRLVLKKMVAWMNRRVAPR